MYTTLKKWMTAPVFEGDEDKTRAAGMLHLILLVFLSAPLVAFLLVLVGKLPVTNRTFIGASMFGTTGVALALLVILHKGYVRVVAWILLCFQWVSTVIQIIWSGGIHSPAISAFIITLLLAGFLIRQRAVFLFTGLSVVSILAIWQLESTGHLPTPVVFVSSQGQVFIILAILSMSAALLILMTRALNQALRHSRAYAKELEQAMRDKTQAETALQESLVQYRSLLENIPAITYIIETGHEPVNRATYISPQVEKITGYTAAELLQDPLLWTKLIHPEDQARVIAESDRADQTGGPFVSDYRVVTRDNKNFWFHDESVLVKNEQGQPLYRLGFWTNITDRKLAELAQQQSETLYRRAIAAADAVPYVLDHATHTLSFMGEGILNMTGYSASEMMGADLWRAVVQAGFPRGHLAHLTYEEADRLTDEDASITWECDYRIRTRDGQTRWIADTSVKSFDEKSGHMISIGIKQDITERKINEAKLRASEARLELLHEIDRALLSANSPREIAKKTLVRIRQLITARRASVTLFNFATQQAFFLTSDLDEGGSIWDTPVTFEEFGEYVIDGMQQNKPFIMNDVLKDPRANELDVQLAKKDGIYSWLYLPLLYQGELIGSLNLGRGIGEHFTAEDAATAQDVANQLAIAVQQTRLHEALQDELAERQRAEAEARRLEELYRRAIDAAGAVPYVIDHADRWNYVFVGDGILSITGYTAAEITSSIWDSMRIQAVPRGRLAHLTFEEADRLTNEEISILWECDFLIRTRDGQIRWVADTSVKTLDEKSGKLLSIGIYQDITERKEAEEKIQRLNETLEARVIERTAQLEAANKELEAFSYSVSHDLRAPLRAITSFSAILKNDFAANLDAQAVHFLNRVIESGAKMNQLIDGLLSFSRLNRKTLSTQSVDVNALVRTLIESFIPETAGRQIEWIVTELSPAQADPLLLQQVFANLIGNAIKYSSKRAQAKIEIGCRSKNNETIYFVRDNGAGFDMKYADKLFGVFQRLHREDEFEGTGIGLATVQRIIHRHGGRIWADAEPDKGATFYFTLA